MLEFYPPYQRNVAIVLALGRRLTATGFVKTMVSHGRGASLQTISEFNLSNRGRLGLLLTLERNRALRFACQTDGCPPAGPML